ncbi:unnamed protein product [Mytilus edulis]|uniref:Uncharacterized protein n=1 Tax=Mytilus edulis TaxID=6550 RepID=A0A8S3QJA7_MYTED|nr:unnamed protein product [Mytilus edulis]
MDKQWNRLPKITLQLLRKTESQTQEIDNNANVNIPKEETRSLKKPFGVREYDSNGNNIKGNVVNKNCGTETKENSVIDIESHQQNGTKGRQLTEEEMSTLRVIGWSSGAADSMTNTPDLAETQDDENMCKLTKGDLNICWQYNVQQPLTHFNNPILNSNKQICGEGGNSSEALPG